MAHFPICSIHPEMQQKYNDIDEPLYDEIGSTKAEDYEAFVPKKLETEYNNEKPMQQISFEMSHCSAYYADCKLKKQN